MQVGEGTLLYTVIERGNQYLLLRSEYIHPGICPKEITKDMGKDLSTDRSIKDCLELNPRSKLQAPKLGWFK